MDKQLCESQCIFRRIKTERGYFVITSLTNRWLKKTFLLESFEVCNEGRAGAKERRQRGLYLQRGAGADRFLYSGTMFNFDAASMSRKLSKALETLF